MNSIDSKTKQNEEPMEEKELTLWAEKELAKARATPRSKYIDIENFKI